MVKENRFVSVVLFVLLLLILIPTLLMFFAMQNIMNTIGLPLGMGWFILQTMLFVLFLLILFWLGSKLIGKDVKTATEIAKERYARGEIDKKEFGNLIRRLRAVK